MASADVSMFTNMDPETRDDSEDPWRFEVSREEVFRLGLPVPLLRVCEYHVGTLREVSERSPSSGSSTFHPIFRKITLPLAFLN